MWIPPPGDRFVVASLQETDLLPAARKHREDLKEQILRENHQVVAKILEGIQAGQPETVAGTGASRGEGWQEFRVFASAS